MPSNLIKGTKTYVDNMLAKSPFVIPKTALIVSSELTGYTIKIDNRTYEKVWTISTTPHSVGDTVKVLMPNGRCDNMFILGTLRPQ